jgi:alkylated DNA repair protein alkB family protein 1
MTLDDPTSSAYKKARRQHLKSLRARNQDVEQDWTPFRAAEKQYKARFPPPDLSGVLDLVTTESHGLGECGKGGWRGRSDTVAWSEVRLNLSEEDTRKGFTIPRVPGATAHCLVGIHHLSPDDPGLVLLRAFVSPTMQRTLVRASLCDQARTPNETNLDTHYILPNDGLWNAHLHARKNPNETAAPIYPRRQYDATTAPDPPGPRTLIDNTPATPDNFTVLSTEPSPPAHPSPTAHPATCASLLPKLRWANIGYSYHWGSKQYDFSKGKGVVRDEYRELCREAVRAVRWEDVFGFVEDENGWSEDDWRTWTETYGILPDLRLCRCEY